MRDELIKCNTLQARLTILLMSLLGLILSVHMCFLSFFSSFSTGIMGRDLSCFTGDFTAVFPA